MSAPLITQHELVLNWTSQLPASESESLRQTIEQIHNALDVARCAPPSLDRRAIALVITKLEEAEHWALHCLRQAVIRELAKEKGHSP